MRFTPMPLAGSYLIDLDKREDERGFFARFFCEREFGEAGLETRFVQINNSLSRDRGTLRGMHYQGEPNAQVKLVRCTQGSIHDVIIDLRPDSPTFKRWIAARLTAENQQMLYVPAGFAHGFQTLRDNTEVLYQMGAYYAPADARGVRWDDPAFAIEWPDAERIINARDATYPDFVS
jgi:dTDP-4-dehydrorhamnose 3,5-epimerase